MRTRTSTAIIGVNLIILAFGLPQMASALALTGRDCEGCFGPYQMGNPTTVWVHYQGVYPDKSIHDPYFESQVADPYGGEEQSVSCAASEQVCWLWADGI